MDIELGVKCEVDDALKGEEGSVPLEIEAENLEGDGF